MESLNAASKLIELGLPLVIVIAAIFARISALVFFLPGVSERMIPVRVKLGAAFAITAIVAPTMAFEPRPSPTLINAAQFIAAEAITGALIGFSIRVGIYIVQTAGSIASQSLSLTQIFGASFDLQAETPISALLMFTAIVLVVVSGLHFEVIGVLLRSFVIFPFGEFPGSIETGSWAAERVAYSFSAALALALPFVTLGFVYNLAIGAANRAMPQLMVAFVGIPAITLGGLVLLTIVAPTFLAVWMRLMDNILITLWST